MRAHSSDEWVTGSFTLGVASGTCAFGCFECALASLLLGFGIAATSWVCGIAVRQTVEGPFFVPANDNGKQEVRKRSSEVVRLAGHATDAPIGSVQIGPRRDIRCPCS
jgi:hypothetical protein